MIRNHSRQKNNKKGRNANGGEEVWGNAQEILNDRVSSTVTGSEMVLHILKRQKAKSKKSEPVDLVYFVNPKQSIKGKRVQLLAIHPYNGFVFDGFTKKVG